MRFLKEAAYIPYRSLIVEGFDNLLVAGRCFSGDQVSSASVRVQAPIMGLGQAAGCAAAKCCEKGIPVQDIDLASFRALEDNKNAWYKISGKVVKSSEEGTKFDLTQYGNFALSDGTTEVYVYGVKTGWGGTKGQFGTLEVKEGDELTIICYKTSYKGLIEADGCVYVSHVAAE